MDILRLTSSAKDLISFNLWQSLIAELIGTLMLVFIGFGSSYGNFNPVKLGIGFGMAATVIIYCIAPISGGHINPAVSFGLLIARQISLVRFFLYSIIQIVGATIGYGCIRLATNGDILKNPLIVIDIKKDFMSSNGTKYVVDVNPIVNEAPWKTLCEVFITFLLVFTVMRICVEKSRTNTEKGLGAFIIGLSITVGVFCGMNISGASMNPAVSIGKYVYIKSENLVAHIIGPLIGAAIAGLLQQLLFTSNLSKQYIKDFLVGKDFEDKNPSADKTTDTLLNDFEKKTGPEKEERHDIDEEKGH